MVLALFLQQYKPYMIRVCCYLKLNLNRNILNTKPFSRDICGLRYWNTNFDITSIRSWFSYLFKFKGQKNLNNENFDNIFETLVTLISKCPGNICPGGGGQTILNISIPSKAAFYWRLFSIEDTLPLNVILYLEI